MSSVFHLTDKQREAVDTLREDCVVYAGAGSGKTRVLVERYVKILEEHGHDPAWLERVVAITFTEKAATEMKERVRREIERRIKWAQIEGNGAKARGCYRLLAELEQVRISTIHSFCQTLLRKYPLEAGLHPAFIVLEEMEAWTLLMEAAEQAMKEVHRDGTEQETKWLERWLVSVRIAEAKQQLCQVMEKLFSFGWSPDDCARITWCHFAGEKRRYEERKRTMPQWEATLFDAIAFLCGQKGKKAVVLSAAWPQLQKEWEERQSWPERMNLLDGIKEALKGNWGGKQLIKEAVAKAKEACEHLAGFIKDEMWLLNEEEMFSLLCQLVERVAREYQKLKTEQRGIDHDEMQWRVCELLTKHPQIRGEIREQVRYLLVDEYQDTNELQKRLIDLITKDEYGFSLPGARFVVGDPKQSIYRFRGADVSLFQRTRAEIEAVPHGKAVELTANFRSCPELISFFNHCFARMMTTDPASPNYFQALQAKREPSAADAVVEWLEVPQAEWLPSGWTEREAEAYLVAKRIDELIRDENVAPKQIAVLMRRMTHVKTWEQALAQFGIPFYVVKGRGFFARQEVRDVLSFLRLLLDPKDRHAWAVVLRSPFCGVSDVTMTWIALADHWQKGTREWAELQQLAPEEKRKLLWLDRLLNRAKNWMGRCTIAELLERILEESGYLLVAWAAPDGNQVSANLNKLIGQVRKWQGYAAFSVYHYLKRMEQLAEQQARETEAAIETEHGNSVKLMTIHQAKGLEFPVVFLPDLGAVPTYSFPGVWLDESMGLIAALPDESGERIETTRYGEAKERNRQLEREESIRLLYVALTRAEERLILSGPIPEKDKDSGRWNEWLCRVLDPRKLDRAGQSWPYADGCRPIRLTAAAPLHEKSRKWTETKLDEWLSGKPLGLGTDPFPLLSDAENGAVKDGWEISVTKWKCLVHCPRQFYYQEMLGLPKLAEEPEEPMYSGTHPMLSAVVRGTAVHRLIELLSRQPDQASSWRDLAKRVWEEQRIPLAARDQATQEIEALIRHFLNSRIYREFNRKNSPLTEVEFVMDTGEMRIQGVIDALIRQPDGSLELIDYKTDHVTAEKAGEAAEEYVPQLQMYSRAVKEKWGVFPKRATLYFLKPNVEICFPVTGEWIESTECAIRSTVRLLQMGTADYPWPTNPGKRCRDCDFAWICENAHSIS